MIGHPNAFLYVAHASREHFGPAETSLCVLCEGASVDRLLTSLLEKARKKPSIGETLLAVHLLSVSWRCNCRNRMLQRDFGFHSFSATTYRELAGWLLPIALTTDVGMVLVGALLDELRERKVLAPALSTIERLAWETRRRAERLVFVQLTAALTDAQRAQLDALLVVQQGARMTTLAMLRQPPRRPTPATFMRPPG
jgi:Domain of unknown function (DUF4158)